MFLVFFYSIRLFSSGEIAHHVFESRSIRGLHSIPRVQVLRISFQDEKYLG